MASPKKKRVTQIKIINLKKVKFNYKKIKRINIVLY